MTRPERLDSGPDLGAEARAGVVHLRILATSDLHACATPDPALPNGRGMGLTQIAGQVEQIRAQSDNCLLFDNGDLLQGGLLGDFLAQPHNWPGGRHPLIAALNCLRYDAAAPGNHDFNYGLPFAERAFAGASFPVVCANLVRRLEPTPALDRHLFPPMAMLSRDLVDGASQRRAVKIAVIGLTPPQTIQWDRQLLAARLEARDMLAAARHWVGQARMGGADIVIVLAHSGVGAARPAPESENVATALRALPGVDAVVAGHTHDVIGSPLADSRGALAPLVMPGSGGSHVGLVDLLLHLHDRTWTVTRHMARAVPVSPPAAPNAGASPVSPGGPAARVAALLRSSQRRAAQSGATVVGRIAQPLDGSLPCLPGDPVAELVNAAQRRLARRLMPPDLAGLPLLSVASPFATGAGGPQDFVILPPGPVTRADVRSLYPFANLACLVTVTGTGLRRWLQRAASIFNVVGRDGPLIDPTVPGYVFDVFDGIDYAFDLSVAAGSPGRVAQLCHAGRPVGDTDRFAVVTNTYRANGGGGYPAVPERDVWMLGQTRVSDAIAAHLRLGHRPADRPANWRLDGPAQAHAWIDAGHGPRTAVRPGLKPLGLTPEGFQRVRLQF